MTALRRTTTRTLAAWRLWASALLLFVVLAHAAAPLAQDQGRARGSAFSAATAEVSLKSGERATVAREQVRIDPLGPVAVVAAPSVRVDPAAAPPVPARAVPVPFVADTALHPISPRAPPLA